jgi:acetoin utilization deacetylase AcuC-like enzyme/GNAT superfamily N-acetyltransferase
VFSIRRIHDDVLPVNQRAITRVQQLLRERFPSAHDDSIEKLPEQLRDPLAHSLRTVVLVAEGDDSVRGFAVLLHAPDLEFCFLDFIVSSPKEKGRGVGGALYERVRDECKTLRAKGVFFECLPDEPSAVSDPAALHQNAARLRFYERYGARPIVGTQYELPLKPGDRDMPYLVFDDLGTGRPLVRKEAQGIVRAILERKYAWLCPPEYIDQVVESFRDDPVRLRPFRYVKRRLTQPAAISTMPEHERILLLVNQRHEIHHVRERGYVEAPVRIAAIRRELGKLDCFVLGEPRSFPDAHITAVHDAGFVSYLKRICGTLKGPKSVYPYVFPIRNAARPPTDLAVRAGYYCIDTFTPLNANAWLAARRAADCALTGAAALVSGRQRAYALVRPPGHHAERRLFGGFCYLNNAAIAAQYLSRYGRVAMLDIDYHHGNGQQDIFWERSDVLTISIHGHPRFAYPYFSGFADERGAGEGLDKNINFPLPERVDAATYRKYLTKALTAIARFNARFMVVSLGFDTGKGDPTGTWNLGAQDFELIGQQIGRTPLPILITQEGGYNTRSVGRYARFFFDGLMQGTRERSSVTPRPILKV